MTPPMPDSPAPPKMQTLLDAYRDAITACDEHGNAPEFVNAQINARIVLEAALLSLVADSERLEWIIDNATSVSDGYGPNNEMMHPAHSTHGRVMLVATTLPTIPRETKDWTRAAIDAARAARSPAPSER